MDFRLAVRSLRKNPGFAVVVVLVLALGIGANTAVFSVINSVLLRPLSYPEPDRIVALLSKNKTRGTTYQVSGPDYHDWRRQSTAFESFAYYWHDKTSVSIGNTADYAVGTAVTADFFDVFATPPSLGRTPPGIDEAVISDAFRRRHFAENEPLGQTLRTMGRTFRIVGVMPPSFSFPRDCDFWVNTAIYPETTSRSAHNYRPVARLKKGVALAEARAQMESIAARLEQQYPENKNKSAAVIPLQRQLAGSSPPTLYLLLAAVAVILLIGCANVAALLLARAAGRTREVAIRAALGATRLSILRQFAVESLLLGGIGGAAGLLFGIWGTDVLTKFAPAGLPGLGDVRLDWRVALFTATVSLIASLAFGLAPALQFGKLQLNDALKQTGRSIVGSGQRARHALVVAEIALSVVLLTSAGLLLKSFLALSGTELGVNTENVLTAEMNVPAASLEDAVVASTFYARLLPELRALPGVKAAAATKTLTSGPEGSNGAYIIEGRPEPAPGEMPDTNFRLVSGDYFRTMGVPMRAGREFTDLDTYDAPFVAVVNETLARQAFGTESPIGHRMRVGLDSNTPLTIVGVVADVRENGAAFAVEPELYMPPAQHPFPGTALHVVVRTAQAPETIVSAVREKARAIRTDVPIRFSTLDATVSQSVSAPRFRALLIGIFASIAVALAVAGIYGLLAYMVTRRVPEIGIRMALGAQRRNILGMVFRGALRLAFAGVVVGLAASWAAARLLTSMLYGVKPTDPAAYTATAALLLAVAMGAALVPARRAATVDPQTALRQE